jgi:hypothetical protein
MMTIPTVRVKDGVQFTVIAPGGFVLLAAIDGAAAAIGHDVTITSACDGCHSGINDPHHRGEAYDVRTHDVPDKAKLLAEIQARLEPTRFYAFIEASDTDNEHIHVQVRKGTVYPPQVPDDWHVSSGE